MKVLILGASGFIGLPVAQALARAGHQVYGLTRSGAKAKKLAAEEIIPVVGEVGRPEDWVHLVSNLDTVIDLVGGSEIKDLTAANFEAILKAVQATRPSQAPKINYIHTSGTWVHGDNREDIVTDSTALKPIELVAWRPALEELVCKNQILNGIVIRPALLYGRDGSLLAELFKSAAEGLVKWAGTPGGRFALIHVDDLANIYVRAAEKAPILGGTVIDAANDLTESVDDVLQKLVKVSGAKGYEYSTPTNLWEVALGTTTLLRPYLGRALLDWRPQKSGLVDGMAIYYASWKASQ